MTFVVGIGPTELHAHIDLEMRARTLTGIPTPAVRVLAATATPEGDHSVVGVITNARPYLQ